MPRCYVGYELDGGAVRAVYVHNNGWPGGGERWDFAVGQILAGYHNSAAAAAALVALGAMSYIGRTLEPTPDPETAYLSIKTEAQFQERQAVELRTTCDYHRWRGGPIAVDAYANRAAYLDDVCADGSIAFIYLYAPDVGWLCARNPNRGDAEDGHGFLSMPEASARFIALDAEQRRAAAVESAVDAGEQSASSALGF